MKRFFVLLIALLLLLSSCSTGDAADTTATPETIETTAEETAAEIIETEPIPEPLSIFSAGKTSFQVIFSENFPAVQSSAAGFVNKLTSLGFATMRVKGDFYKKEAPEILIGPTNRQESIDTLASDRKSVV